MLGGGLLICGIIILILVNNNSYRSYYRSPRRHYRRMPYYSEMDYLPPDYEDYFDYEQEHQRRYQSTRIINTLIFVFLLMLGFMYIEGQNKTHQSTTQDNRTPEILEMVDYSPSQTSY